MEDIFETIHELRIIVKGNSSKFATMLLSYFDFLDVIYAGIAEPKRSNSLPQLRRLIHSMCRYLRTRDKSDFLVMDQAMREFENFIDQTLAKNEPY